MSSELELCLKCQKPKVICLCESLTALPNQAEIVIAQHPQEPDKILGTARLLELSLKRSKLVTFLSRPNLKSVVGEGAEPKRWGILYLGSAEIPSTPGLYQVGKDNHCEPWNRDQNLSLKGVIILDGTWSQAKAMWWRNPWMTKLTRLVLRAPQPSLYGKLRKEPKHEALSTLEAAAFTLSYLEDFPPQPLCQVFSQFLERVQSSPEVLQQIRAQQGRSKRFHRRRRR